MSAWNSCWDKEKWFLSAFCVVVIFYSVLLFCVGYLQLTSGMQLQMAGPPMTASGMAATGLVPSSSGLVPNGLGSTGSGSEGSSPNSMGVQAESLNGVQYAGRYHCSRISFEIMCVQAFVYRYVSDLCESNDQVLLFFMSRVVILMSFVRRRHQCLLKLAE